MQTLNEALGGFFLQEDAARSAAEYFRAAKNDPELLSRLYRGLEGIKTAPELKEVYDIFIGFMGDEHCRTIDRRRNSAKAQQKTPAQLAAAMKAARVSAARRLGKPRSQETKDRIAQTLRARHAADNGS